MVLSIKFCLYSFTKVYLAVIILVKYFGKLIYESDEKEIMSRKGKYVYILFNTLNLLRLQYFHD